MKRFSWLISRYLAKAVLPYFLFSWILLTVILFVQQTSRYSEIFFNANIPRNLIWQLSLALVPNVVAFTCPMAVLIGIVIGLLRMQSDNELIAVRTIGVGNIQMTVPMVFLGIVLSAFALLVNLYGVPLAARIVKKVALQTALYKLESPIEPGVFNTEINGSTIYVKDGDFEKGTWKNVFIYYDDQKNKQTRLITSKAGRIDSNEERSELVLENALVNTISNDKNHLSLITENISAVRINLQTRREDAIKNLSDSPPTPDELGLSDLLNYARSKTGKERTEAEILWQRRIVLSITPLIFAILGVALVVRFNRGGQGFGIFLALISLVIHYLLTLMGEQLARTNQISVLTAGLLPIAASCLFIIWFFYSARIVTKKIFLFNSKRFNFNPLSKIAEKFKGNFYPVQKTYILDLDITFNLLKNFLTALSFLTLLYLVFTAFELWKFAGEINKGFFILLEYLYYLLPFVYIQLCPSALMIAILAAFIIKSRQNEIVTWTAAGRSVYRLLQPCFLLMILIGFVNWEIQETVLPTANHKQDELRSYIRSRGAMPTNTKRYWIADDNRIYSFELNSGEANTIRAVKNLTVYEFSDNQTNLQKIYKTGTAIWEKNKLKLNPDAEATVWQNGKVSVESVPNFELNQNVNPFANLYQKPSHLTARETAEFIRSSESETEQRNYSVALQKKYSTAFLPFVLALFTAPFALSLSRKGKVLTIGYAVGIWLLFVASSSTFEQLGINGFITPEIAVWSPVILFSIFGFYLLTRLRT